MRRAVNAYHHTCQKHPSPADLGRIFFVIGPLLHLAAFEESLDHPGSLASWNSLLLRTSRNMKSSFWLMRRTSFTGVDGRYCLIGPAADFPIMKPVIQEPDHMVVSDPNEMAKSRLDVVVVVNHQKEIAVIRKKPTRKGR
jgi:hypothetical protein